MHACVCVSMCVCCVLFILCFLTVLSGVGWGRTFLTQFYTQSMHLFFSVSYSVDPAHNFCPPQPIIITTDIFMLP